MSIFQSRHYIAIAAVIANATRDEGNGEIVGRELVTDLIAMLAKDNPNFNRTAFEDAAELTPGETECPICHAEIEDIDKPCPECGDASLVPPKRRK